MLKKYMRCFFFMAITINLAGCTWLSKSNFVKKRETEYLHSQAAPALQIPPGVYADKVGNDYPIPPVANQTNPVNLLPPDSLADKVAKGEMPTSVLKQQPVAKSARKEVKATTTQNNLPAVTGVNASELVLAQPLEQAWLSVGNGLKRAGYTIANDNPKTGTYYLLDVPATNGKVTKETPIYQLHVRGQNDSTIINLTDNQGNAVAPAISQRVLADLNKALAGKTPSSFSRWFKNLF